MSPACCSPSNASAMTTDVHPSTAGVDLLAAGRFRDALAPLRLALSLGDTTPATLLNLAIAEDRAGDRERGRRLMPLVTEGFAGSLAEAATRFAITHQAMGSILVGMATVEEFQASLAAVLKGPLPQAALDRLTALTTGFSGESR